MHIKIQALREKDIPKVTKIASMSFGGMSDLKKAEQWVRCSFRAFPRMQYFVAKTDEEVMGYVLWVEKGGFREEAVLELDQIAVKEDFRGKGVGTKLIQGSLQMVQDGLSKRGAKLKLIEVTTGTENQAQRLYQKALSAKPEAIIKDLFRGDEVIMIARF